MNFKRDNIRNGDLPVQLWCPFQYWILRARSGQRKKPLAVNKKNENKVRKQMTDAFTYPFFSCLGGGNLNSISLMLIYVPDERPR